MLDLWIVRHGETDWNLQGRIQGWTDVPLNAKGITQAHRLAKHLEGIPFRAVYSSDLKRAVNTANILATHILAPQFVHTALRERGFGMGEGLYREEMNRRFPNGVPDAESDTDVLARIDEFLQDVTRSHETGRVLCVTHGATIRLMLRQFQHVEIPPLYNTGVSRIRWDGARWNLIGANWAQHLQDSADKVESDPHALGFRATVTTSSLKEKKPSRNR